MSYSERRFCVYFYKDKTNNEIIYVGHGNIERPYSVSSKHSKIKELNSLSQLEIIIAFDNLTKLEAIQIEDDYLSVYLNNKTDGFALLNKTRSNVVKPIEYEKFSELFYYDETSPTFMRWKVDRFGTGKAKIVKKDDVAGVASKPSHKKRKSYANVNVDYKTYVVHRIIYCIYHKVNIPTDMVVDHVDGNHANNHISNLRLVSQKDNALNIKSKKISSSNKTGVVGVSLAVTADGRYWRASIGSRRANSLKQKYFNIKIHGNDEAFRLACEWRKQAELQQTT